MRFFSQTAPVETCLACGKPSPSNSRFCVECGAAMAVDEHEPAAPKVCEGCGGEGANLAPSKVYCSGCRWLRPLGPDYEIPIAAFMWKLDADAMKVLSNMGPLTTAAHAVSKKVGRRWLEASVTGVRLSERQLPAIFAQAIRAARIIGLVLLC